jgi:hypothetical protein
MNIFPDRAALAPGGKASFVAVGGTPPFTFSMLDGAGSINPVTGMYTAPEKVPGPKDQPTVQIEDSTGATAYADIVVGSPLFLFCEIIRHELGLPEGRVYLYNQKLNKLSDQGLFIAVGVGFTKPYATVVRFDPAINAEVRTLRLSTTLSIDVMSKGEEALERKEEVLLALSGIYSQQVQAANGFKIARNAGSFVPLNELDGSAIPYRFNLSVPFMYNVRQVKRDAEYFDTFGDTALIVNP